MTERDLEAIAAISDPAERFRRATLCLDQIQAVETTLGIIRRDALIEMRAHATDVAISEHLGLSRQRMHKMIGARVPRQQDSVEL